MTMEQITERTGIKTSSVCGRLGDLMNPDIYRVAMLAAKPLVCKAGYGRAGSGCRVNIYAAAPSGVAALRPTMNKETDHAH